ncbi:hypothetical protein BDV96DRAFT_596873 [Lophiotrema nucula]|uniref:Uncharacterized protein n=1 Tax=Lophiotrema nucula TaxID=690887 RepID=A0A6A5ZIX8_9PLEO|nr:hypothetical protein BDV96DRAFT_596873 [Lophiotrema nucula]
MSARQIVARQSRTFLVGHHPGRLTPVRTSAGLLAALGAFPDNSSIVGVSPQSFEILSRCFDDDRNFSCLYSIHSKSILLVIVETWTLAQFLMLFEAQNRLLATGCSVHKRIFPTPTNKKKQIIHPVKQEVDKLAFEFLTANFGDERLDITTFVAAWTGKSCHCSGRRLDGLSEIQRSLVEAYRASFLPTLSECMSKYQNNVAVGMNSARNWYSPQTRLGLYPPNNSGSSSRALPGPYNPKIASSYMSAYQSRTQSEVAAPLMPRRLNSTIPIRASSSHGDSGYYSHHPGLVTPTGRQPHPIARHAGVSESTSGSESATLNPFRNTSSSSGYLASNSDIRLNTPRYAGAYLSSHGASVSSGRSYSTIGTTEASVSQRSSRPWYPQNTPTNASSQGYYDSQARRGA